MSESTGLPGNFDCGFLEQSNRRFQHDVLRNPPTKIIVFGVGIIVAAQTYKTVEEKNLHENINYRLEGYHAFGPAEQQTPNRWLGGSSAAVALLVFGGSCGGGDVDCLAS